jgi:hypothetical protein
VPSTKSLCSFTACGEVTVWFGSYNIIAYFSNLLFQSCLRVHHCDSRDSAHALNKYQRTSLIPRLYTFNFPGPTSISTFQFPRPYLLTPNGLGTRLYVTVILETVQYRRTSFRAQFIMCFDMNDCTANCNTGNYCLGGYTSASAFQ